jgi:hypothetical protein
MGEEGTRLIAMTVRMTEQDHAALKAEASAKGLELATHAREILKAHLLKQEFTSNLKDDVITILESEEFDDIIVQKFLRAMENRKKD